MNFLDKKIAVKRTVILLAKNGIQVDDNEAIVILNFLYLVAKIYERDSDLDLNIKEKSNCQKARYITFRLLSFNGSRISLLNSN
nr:hypothetical protein [Mucilaginibacter sp. L294]